MRELKQQKSLQSFRTTRQSVNLVADELVQFVPPASGATLPLIVQPAIACVDLAEWLAGQQDYLQSQLWKYGAILFRGFNLNSASAFESVCQALSQDLFNHNGEHPRASISGNVYTPVFYPAEHKLLWHNENSFNHEFPQKIFFGCSQPASQGGETPIVDSRQVWQQLDHQLRQGFLDKQIMYLRNYGYGLGLDWQTVFQTQDKAEVEAICRREQINFEWRADGGLRTTAVRPAVVKHPQTGEFTWFGQPQHWHPSCLDRATREALQASFPDEDLPRNCYYGDGSVIEDAVMAELCAVYQQLEVSFPWQHGDLLLLDNLLVAHARNPYMGKRQLFVAMGELMNFDQLKIKGNL